MRPVLAFLMPSSPLLSLQTLRAASNPVNCADVGGCNPKRQASIFFRASLRRVNQFAFRHSSLNRPLKLST
jgi:hypothetical protein